MTPPTPPGPAPLALARPAPMALLLALLLAAPPATAQAPPAGARAAPAGPFAAETVQGTLTEAGLRARLVGNTVSGSEGGLAFEQFIDPDGTLRGRDRRGAFAGTWTIRGDAICLTSERARGCLSAAISGAGVTWFRNGVLDGRGALRAGNPDKL